LSSEARHNLFLTFEEALNNVLKHSAASKVKVEMVVSPAEFEINVADNGRGFEVNGPVTSGSARHERGVPSGNGLRNMRQRLADVGGECLIRSRPGNGTMVSLRIHLNRELAAAP
jgi:signal transduction histidine kinase